MATNLVAGDLIADIDGGAADKVVANALTQTSEKVYNFEVEGNHNYFADELGLWVHNGSGIRGSKPGGIMKLPGGREIILAPPEIEVKGGREPIRNDASCPSPINPLEFNIPANAKLTKWKKFIFVFGRWSSSWPSV